MAVLNAAGGATTLLRRATTYDGVLLTLFGADLLIFAGPLAALTGLSAPVLLAAGAIFLVEGIVYLMLLRRDERLRPVGQAMLMTNLAGVLLIPVLLTTGWLPLTSIGIAALVGVCLLCVGFGAAQWAGLRRLG